MDPEIPIDPRLVHQKILGFFPAGPQHLPTDPELPRPLVIFQRHLCAVRHKAMLDLRALVGMR